MYESRTLGASRRTSLSLRNGHVGTSPLRPPLSAKSEVYQVNEVHQVNAVHQIHQVTEGNQVHLKSTKWVTMAQKSMSPVPIVMIRV